MSRGDNMNVFETIIFYLVFIVFPLTLWLLYQAYSKTMNKEKSNITVTKKGRYSFGIG